MPSKKKKQPVKFKQPVPRQKDQGELISKVVGATLTSSVIMLGIASWALSRTTSTEPPAFVRYFQILPVVVGIVSAIAARSVKELLHGKRSETLYGVLVSAVLSLLLSGLILLIVR